MTRIIDDHQIIQEFVQLIDSLKKKKNAPIKSIPPHFAPLTEQPNKNSKSLLSGDTTPPRWVLEHSSIRVDEQ